MDWADDITYSAHDLEDFYRAGKIPLHSLQKDAAERAVFLDAYFQRKNINEAAERAEWRKLAAEVTSYLPVTGPYVGSRTQKAALRAYVSSRITRALTTTTLAEEGLVRDAQV